MAFSAVNELLLPALKAAVAKPDRTQSGGEEDTSWDGWELAPPAADSTLSLPGTIAHETTVGRLCELGPKVWLLCVHCAVLTSSCVAIAESLPPPLYFLAHFCLVFSAWSVLWLGSGVLENVVRRHLWLRLLENGLLLQPKPAGTIVDRCGSPEYRLLCCGLGLMGLLHLSVIGAKGLGAQLGNAAALLILSCSWTEWRVPSAAVLLCNGPGGSVDIEFVKLLTCVSEEAVAAACAAMPLDAPTSFGGLAALIRSVEVAKAAPIAPVTPVTPVAPAAASTPAAPAAADLPDEAAARWATERNWAMRFMGVPPAIALLQPLLLTLARGLQRLHSNGFLSQLSRLPTLPALPALPALPVRRGASFKAAKDRTFSARISLWNVVFVATVLLTQAACRGGPAGGRLATTLVLAAVVALAARATPTPW